MIIECPACHAKYQYAEERFDGKPSKKIRCARCREVFEIRNPAFTVQSDSTKAARRAQRPSVEAPLKPAASAHAAPESPDHPPLQLPAGKRLSLAILEGPDAGSVFRIEKPRVTIGRSNADLTINDTQASRQHAAVEISDTSYFLTDLGSTNGTFCNGERISDAVELTDKGEFQVGSTTVMLIVTDDQ